MSYDAVVHQIECRWRKTADFSPIAASCDSRTTEMWFSRLSADVRPPERIGNIHGPESSVLYQLYPNGDAAVVWRQHDLDAITLEDSGNRRTQVARILIGTRDSLDPDAAMALCRGWQTPGLIDPRSGRVQINQELPVIPVGMLQNLVFKGKSALDSAARKEPGLARLIAAMLREQSIPLNVQLPLDEIGEPATGSQVLLLRGLWVTTRPLLEGIPGLPPAGSSWSFSTYERPIAGSEPNTLPHIVFRVVQSGQQPQSGFHRPETKVRPRDPTGPLDPDDFDAVAELLASAYHQVGGPELAGRLSDVASSNRSLQARINETTQVLRIYGPGGAGAKPAGRGHRRAQPEQDGRLGSERDDGLEPELAQATTGSAHVSLEESTRSEAPHVATPPTPALPSAGMADSRAAFSPSETLPADRPEDRPGEYDAASAAVAADTDSGKHRSQLTPQSTNAVTLLSRDAPGVDSAAESPIMQIISIIRDSRDPTAFKMAAKWLFEIDEASSPERAEARGELLKSEWCYTALCEHDPDRMGLMLTRLFEVTVIPDLQRENVQSEIAQWAYRERARASVIRALFRAAERHGDENIVAAMNFALLGALGMRWADQHDIVVKDTKTSIDPRGGAPGTYQRPSWRWRFFTPLSATATICLLTGALVLSLVFR